MPFGAGAFLAAITDAGATAAKNDALAALITQLRALAAYVDANHGNDLGVLLSSRFKAASTSHAGSPLPQAVIQKITLAGPGRLLAEGNVMDNVKSWEARWKPEASPASTYQHANNLGAAREMTLTDLPSMTRVMLQTRSVGGAPATESGATA